MRRTDANVSRSQLFRKLFFFLLSLAIVLLPLAHNSAGNQSDEYVQNNRRTLSLSVVIPSTFHDFLCFSEQLFERIAANTVRPDELVLVVSGVLPFEDLASKVRVSRSLFRVPNIVEIRTELHNQAWAKNLGVKLASGDLILFFDIDDVLYPWAFAAVKSAYASQPNEPVGIMFSHGDLSSNNVHRMLQKRRTPHCTIKDDWRCDRLNLELYTPFCKLVDQNDSQYKSSRLYNDCFAEHVKAIGETHVNWRCISSDRPMFAAGWFSIKREFAQRFAFDTDFDVAEDGRLIGTLLAYKLDVLYIDIPIAFYNMQHDAPECALVDAAIQYRPARPVS